MAIPAGTTPETTNRLVAIACAMKIVPDSVIGSGASGSSEVTNRARTFEKWLGESDTSEDTAIRRLLLMAVCDKAPPATPPDRIRAFVKDLHRHTRH